MSEEKFKEIYYKIRLELTLIFKFTLMLAIYLGGPASLVVAGFLTGAIVLFGVLLFLIALPFIIILSTIFKLLRVEKIEFIKL